MELLAPCGDEQSFYAAVENGADAIYLGLGAFNARAKSTFFNTENIRTYVRQAHLKGVKVYVTTNTILLDEELPAFLNQISACVDAKVDAFIIQDLAVATIIKQNFDDVVMHASTQMGIHNTWGAIQAKKLGFTRIVLSREVKLQDIQNIKKTTGLEIEYFVQGALCVAFSGNCYLSSTELDKSGNRGKCAQLCRLPYTAELNGNIVGSGYLLSARDLCLIDSLAELKKAGVDSLKIEGRLRRAGYVAQCVHSYKKALLALEQNQPLDTKQEKQDLAKVFSRGEYNERAYLDSGVPSNVINPMVQNHLGIHIGSVIKTAPFKDLTKIWIKSNHTLHTGDGLKFWDDGEKASLGVGNVEKISTNEYVIYSKTKVQVGWKVYLTLDNEHESNLLLNKKKLPIDVDIVAKINQPLSLTIKSGPCSITHSSSYICPPATNAPTKGDELLNQVGKLNDTEFVLGGSKVTCDNVFIPKSIINQLRRDAIQALTEEIISCNERHITAKQKSNSISLPSITVPHPTQNIFYFDSIDNLTHDISPHDLLCLCPTIYDIGYISLILSKAKQFSKNLGLCLPILANDNDCKKIVEIVSQLPHDIVYILQNIGHLQLACEQKLTFIAGEHLNIANSFSSAFWINNGATGIIFSKEFDVPNPNYYKLLPTNINLMTFAHCPYKTLFNNDCKNCKYSPNLKLHAQNGHIFDIKRYQITQCYFTLFAKKASKAPSSSVGNVIDLR